MKKEGLAYNLASQVFLNALLVTSWGFTLRQKEALRERDGNKCNAPFKHDCNWKKAGHAHHILPQGYAKRFGIDPDFAENGIYICENAHIKVIHPDAQDAKRQYVTGDKKAFEKLIKDRSDKLDERTAYWNDIYDRALYAVALRNTQRAEKKGKWFWPFKGKGNHVKDDSYRTD